MTTSQFPTPGASPSEPHTFTLDLGGGVRCTARFDPSRLGAGDGSPLHIEWTGPRKASHFPAYLPWALSVWQHVASSTGRRLFAVFGPPTGKPFAFVFRPGCPPERIPLP